MAWHPAVKVTLEGDTEPSVVSLLLKPMVTFGAGLSIKYNGKSICTSGFSGGEPRGGANGNASSIIIVVSDTNVADDNATISSTRWSSSHYSVCYVTINKYIVYTCYCDGLLTIPSGGRESNAGRGNRTFGGVVTT